MPIKPIIALILLAAAGTGLPGCATLALEGEYAALEASDIPRELSKVSFPSYRVEPPDILLIESGIITRGANKPLKRSEVLIVQIKNGVPAEFPDDMFTPDIPAIVNQDGVVQREGVDNSLQRELARTLWEEDAPVDRAFRIINGPFVINPEGEIDLGPIYGAIPVAGLTLAQARMAIEDHLRRSEQEGGVGLLNPRVAAQLSAVQGKQPIVGEHLVRPDGTVSLGVHGEIYVAGMTLDDVKYQVEEILRSEGERDPEVSVDVLAYNSKLYYVIMEGGGFGEEVIRLPWTGNETVLDAIAQVQGLSQVSSKRIWIARPAPAGTGCAQILDVHWRAITAEGITTTNYQIAPGDRIYVAADKLIVINNAISKLIAPVERVFGFILLGSGTVSNLRFWSQQGQSSGFGGGF